MCIRDRFLTILKIRLLQFKRLLDELGFFMVLVFLFATAPLWLRMVEWGIGLTGLQLAGLMGFSLFSIQLQREDKAFLRLVYPNSRFIFLFEYFLLSLPLFLWMLYKMYWWGFILLAIQVILVPLIGVTLKWRGRQPVSYTHLTLPTIYSV